MRWSQPDRILFDRGFVPNQAPINSVPESVLDGLNVIFRGPRRFDSFRGMGSSIHAGQATMMLVGTVDGGLATGTLILYRQNTYWFIGSGAVFLAGVSIGSASSALQLRVGGTAFPAGLPAPPAPLISTIGTGVNNGSYSVKLTLVRSATGAESNASVASNVVSASNNQIRIPVPASQNGADKFAVYASKRGFGSSGPWYFLREFPISGANVTVEWYDGDLAQTLAPLDYDQPLSGTHVFALGACIVVAGIVGGIGISPSIPGRPEAFPPDFITFLNPAEPIIGVKGRATDGFQYIACANSLHAALLTPDPDAPVVTRAIWSDVGFPNPDAFCLVESEIYGHTGARGPVRTSQQNEPDTSFAYPVASYFATWNAAQTVVGYSPEENLVVFCNGTAALAFNRTTGQWSTPLQLNVPGSVDAAVTFGGRLYLSAGGGLYPFNTGSGTSWYVVPAFRDAGAPGLRKTLRRVQIVSDCAVSVDMLRDLSLAAVPGFSFAVPAPSGSLGGHSDWKALNLQLAHSYSVRMAGSGADQSVYECILDGRVNMKHR